MMKNIKTIWHFAFCFFESEHELNAAVLEVGPIYAGALEDMTYEQAAKIAQIHPKCMTYYERTMMPLFQGKGKLSSGTESPQRALESYKTAGESQQDMPYILVWKMFGDDK